MSILRLRFFLLLPVLAALAACGGESVPPITPRCVAYYTAELAAKAPKAAAWCKGGAVMRWKHRGWLTPIDLFYRCGGKRSDPAVYLQHGWPTSGFDFHKIFDDLSTDHYVCALDMPGYGFSDKPDGYSYSLLDDGEIVESFIRDVMKVKDVSIVSHDRGDSVALELLHRYLADPPGFALKRLVMMNGSIYLPKAAISAFQKALLSTSTGPEMAKNMTSEVLAGSLGMTTFSPTLTLAERYDLASVFDFDKGTDRLHQTIQYLHERAVHEEKRWLAALGKSRMPVTLIWGELDRVSIPAVADHVWDKVLAARPAPATYWRVPCGNHYVQHDRHAEVLAILRGEELPEHTEIRCARTNLYRKR